MKIVNICQNDWANFSHDNANSLRSIGIDCTDIKMVKHKFSYKSESPVVSINLALEKIKRADVVQIMHSDKKALIWCQQLNKKRIIVYHAGTDYRKNSIELNKLFNPHVERSVIALGEFSGIGSKNETYLVGAINTNKIKPNYKKNDYVRIAHYPSSEIIKGSETIDRIVKKVYSKNKNFYFNMSYQKVPHHEQMERIGLCDVYIELYAPKQDGFNYGSWGITALEAAALGKIVVTCHTTESVYEKQYGVKTPFFVSNTEKELYNNIEYLSNINSEELIKLQRQTREWVVKYHSYEASAKRLIQLL